MVAVSQHLEAVLGQHPESPLFHILPLGVGAALLFLPSLVEEHKDKLVQQQSA